MECVRDSNQPGIKRAPVTVQSGMPPVFHVRAGNVKVGKTVGADYGPRGQRLDQASEDTQDPEKCADPIRRVGDHPAQPRIQRYHRSSTSKISCSLLDEL